MVWSKRVMAAGFFVVCGAMPARAHFQELIPTPDLVTELTGRAVALELTFTHPFEQGPVMAMAKPERFGVLVGDRRIDLIAALKPVAIGGKAAYTAKFQVEGPGSHVFFVSPAPYWEPAEGKYIVHHTKVVVDAFAGGEGWDALVGLPVEIRPLTRPYGLWAGNAFTGVVLKDGQTAPFANIEIEYRNTSKTVAAPADAFVTQTVKADANGTFTYVMPRAGWWGFAALLTADAPLKGPDGKDAPVETGGLIWVKTVDMK